ncbi:tRNA pseudouridine38-40 synthase [Desulfocicer vacuolatum DSM 3385]|uniref:tRNA pseudouridine synthase A n=1 Tax=Desulfocicer vacuolatum DSM 3385 TaxID=1121400 RepID=A0A1W2B7X9_9BACT|nr:tRNA pseudouridine(38-40) synthase TruA [Desulfocicer vacuolatum]SMC69075.1 tRNA pseudouridine38-40 synthase [Desulfocicer vacuolatum DSM 3385]
MTQYRYLVHIQYLGFRYHGWLKQPGLRTVESMVEKTIKFVLGHNDFKILGSSRTDAKVSANHSAFELFVNEPLDPKIFFLNFNKNLPNDIKILKIESVDKTFNIIQTPRTKEYLYLFSHGEKMHPFCAPFMHSSIKLLDIELMKQGARLFKGKHSFINYCTKPGSQTTFDREILESKIEENTILKANFFPEKSYVYHIHAKGFLRYQVRLVMGQLFCLGRGETTLNKIKETLNNKAMQPLRFIAPSSGLILNKINFC